MQKSHKVIGLLRLQAPVDAPGKKQGESILSSKGNMKTLVVCSGGLDSVTLAYKVANEGTLTSLLSFNYGQRHLKELDCARRCADQLGVPHTVIDLSQVGTYLVSALTPPPSKALAASDLSDLTPKSAIDVPEGHYAEASMKTTVVPNRNAIMMTIAFGMAASQHSEAVAMAVHGGDHYIYPDCRPGFMDAFGKMQSLALEGVADVSLYTPFLHQDKTDIVREGVKQNVPFSHTWSCYQGMERHCGRCGTCVERREAFYLANEPDPTDYEDPHFWQSVT